MNGIELRKDKNKSSALVRYVFGVFFLLSSIVYFSSSFTTGLFFLLAGIVTIPPTAAQLERKLNISMSGIIRFFVVFLLVIVAFASIPHIDSTTALNNSTDVIAAPLTSVNGTTTITMPASTETHEVAETPDNKGRLDIVTSPTGAIVTVDGVSQGLSPVKGLSVDEGDHIVDLDLSGYDAKTLTVYITNSDTKTINWVFTPDVNPSPASTETPEVTTTETPISEPAKAQVTTSDSKSTTTSNITNTNSASYYENSKSTSTTTSSTTNTGSTLIYASSKSDVYHSAGCSYVQRIKSENLIVFHNIQEAKAAGYRACKKCGG
ncbi:MAG: PEGA domain-containing protein [Methanosarcina barkeri]|nr:PEGA domain-containing protein [Methanosarcina sp. ERenArc_MAG2]